MDALDLYLKAWGPKGIGFRGFRAWALGRLGFMGFRVQSLGFRVEGSATCCPEGVLWRLALRGKIDLGTGYQGYMVLFVTRLRVNGLGFSTKASLVR